MPLHERVPLGTRSCRARCAFVFRAEHERVTLSFYRYSMIDFS